jgi:hypothetical protein
VLLAPQRIEGQSLARNQLRFEEITQTMGVQMNGLVLQE